MWTRRIIKLLRLYKLEGCRGLGGWEISLLKELTFTELYYEFNKLLPFILKTPFKISHQEKEAHGNYVLFARLES